MVVKSAKANNHVADLEEVFDATQENRLKFNLEKIGDFDLMDRYWSKLR